MSLATAAEIADRLAVQDVMIRYATSVDARDMERYASCFTKDVAVSGFGPGPMHGREAFLAYVTEALQRFKATQHLLGNQVVELQGDRATLRTYVQATHVLAAQPDTTLTLWATYHDELVRHDGEWRICEHRLEPGATQTTRSL
ncbi:MAG: nuclear transport factor 2 family protein [Dehalococcoidia bacterium]|nr:nuclear transport factor 2 family protein [Dehalococcoidia bacterium]